MSKSTISTHNNKMRGQYARYGLSCDRCHGGNGELVMSAFNTEKICESCKRDEMRRPDYAEAEGANAIAARNGMKDWQGIGFNFVAGEEI